MTLAIRRPTLFEHVIIGITSLNIALLLRQLLYMLPLNAIPEHRLQWIGATVVTATVLGVATSFYGLGHMIFDEMERGRIE